MLGRRGRAGGDRIYVGMLVDAPEQECQELAAIHIQAGELDI